jgi:zona occludens toxin (predicted ATPase)
VALIVVTGSPGSGKSSSAIEDFIVPALVAGRPVVTNIEGMRDPERQEKLRAIVLAKGGSAASWSFTCIGHSELEGGAVFPVNLGSEDDHGVRQWDDSKALAPFGTVLVWDEADAFETKNLGKSWEVALRMHRHWASATSAFDIVLLHQNWKSLAPLVRANAAEVYEYVPHANDNKRLRFVYKSPGDRDLARKAKETLREVLNRDLAVRDTYKSTVVNAGVKDNVAKHFWQTEYFKKWRKVAILLFIVGAVWLYFAVGYLRHSFGLDKPKPQALVSGAPGVPGVAQAAPIAAPLIVGRVPAASGWAFMVKSGDSFTLVQPGRDGRVMFNGKVVPWPDDF